MNYKGILNMEYKHQDRKTFLCKRSRMLEFLRKKGFIPVKTLPDFVNPKYYNWLFENSPELEEAITEYFEQYEAWKAEHLN